MIWKMMESIFLMKSSNMALIAVKYCCLIFPENITTASFYLVKRNFLLIALKLMISSQQMTNFRNELTVL